MLSASLQATSRVLSAQGRNEQAAIQEAAVQLLGMAMLDAVEVRVVNDAAPGKEGAPMPQDRSAPVAALRDLDVGVWVGSESGNLVLVKSVSDESEWNELPLLFQNYVAEKHFPCHFLVSIEEMNLPGDTQHRHYAESVFVILQRRDDGRLESSVVFGTDVFRKLEPIQATREALAHLEPFMRIAFAALVQPKQEVSP